MDPDAQRATFCRISIRVADNIQQVQGFIFVSGGELLLCALHYGGCAA